MELSNFFLQNFVLVRDRPFFVQAPKSAGKTSCLLFSSLASTCVEQVSMQPTKHSSIIRGALSSVTLYTDALVSGFDVDPYEHTHVINSDRWCLFT